MPRVLGKLSQRRVATAKPKRGRKALVLADGGNLYLQCTLADDDTTVRRSWVFRYEVDGRRREMGLGAAHTIGLAEARLRARALRVQLVDNIDPLAQREADRQARLAAQAKLVTFEQCAERYLKLHAATWGASHRHQWHATLDTYILPVIGNLSVADIDQAIVMKIVEPIWTSKPTTAGRVRNRLECILDYAAANQFRSSENPARHVVSALPKKSKIARVAHFAGVSWEEMPAFMLDLRRLQSTAAQCLEFLVLTATRSGEALGARWSEIDRQAKVWVISAERTKARTEHRIPLSKQALELLDSLPHDGPFVFGGNRPLQETALRRQALAKLRPGDNLQPSTAKRPRPKLRSTVTVHGMRGAFKTWAGESTNFASETIEVALAHRLGNKTEQSYEKGDKYTKRSRLMQAWADYLAKPAKAATDNVVKIGVGA
jgi:integrase